MREIGWVRLGCATPLGASGPWIIPLDPSGSNPSLLSFRGLSPPSIGDNPGGVMKGTGKSSLQNKAPF